MADDVELTVLQQDEKKPNNVDGIPVLVLQPRGRETASIQTSGDHNANERRMKGRKERQRRRLKQLEEDEIRRRGRRKRKRLEQAKRTGKSEDVKEKLKKDKEADRLNEQERREFERTMDKTLDDGDLDEIQELITVHKLTKCKTNSLEKSLEVSYRLKNLAQTNGPDAEDFKSLADAVEDFAIQLLEPLKSDDMKRAIFEADDFDRIWEKTVLFQQKKFVSHPVVYNLLMRRWAGSFYHLRYKPWMELQNFKWMFLNLWTVFDVVLFPLVFTILYLIHILIGLAKTRQESNVVLILSACTRDSFEDMQDLSSACLAILRPQHTTIIYDNERPTLNEFNEQTVQISEKTESDENSLIASLKSAKKKFQKFTGEHTNQVLIVMTDDKFGVPCHKLTREIHRIENEGVNVVSVGFGVHPEINELETMATKEKDVILYHGEIKLGEVVQKILKTLSGYDIFDRYVQYFNTPYFIFVRDTLSYLALLGLHFAMCLQPSTLHFTALEWVIMFFFIGRLWMEIYQAVMEKHLSDKLRHASSDYGKKEKGIRRWEREETTFKDDEMQDCKIPTQHNRRKISRVFMNTISRYFSDRWNILDAVTLVVYIALVTMRSIAWAEEHYSSVSNNRLLAVAGYLYGLNAMFLTLRVFGYIMESRKSTGSIQIALFQILNAVLAIFGQFLAATLAFSLAITKVYVVEISYSARNSSSHGFCEIGNTGIACWWSSTTHLLWSLLGDPNIDPLKSSDETSDVLAKLLYGSFLIMAVVMLMNMMIALLSNIYQEVQDNAFYEWSYRKATTIRTYNNYHAVPVPFNIISLTLLFLRYIYKTICCCRCRKGKNKYPHKRNENHGVASFFDCLVFDLQAEYFSARGYTFSMSESNKMDLVLRETEGNRQLIGHIANQVFKYGKKEAQQLTEDMKDQNTWDTRGVDIRGHQLTYVDCNCSECVQSNEGEQTKFHGARFLKPLSKQWPGFEVLIQESIERRLIAIGVVTGEWYNPHMFPGWYGNSAGYHVDEAKIFDRNNQKIGIECDLDSGGMAHRGDLIGCKILYDRPSRDHTLPVSFTLNGRVIGEATITNDVNVFYPFVGIGWEGITLLFKLCSSQQKGGSSEKDRSSQLLEKIYDKLDNLQLLHEDRESLLLNTIAKLEKKVDLLYDRCRCSKDVPNESSEMDSAL